MKKVNHACKKTKISDIKKILPDAPSLVSQEKFMGAEKRMNSKENLDANAKEKRNARTRAHTRAHTRTHAQTHAHTRTFAMITIVKKKRAPWSEAICLET